MVSHASSAAGPFPITGDPATRQALDAIRRIVRALREASRASERAVGLSAAQLFVLQRLAGSTPLSINELAERTFTHQSSVSVVVSRLVARGLVARRVSATDGRRVEIELSAAGRALLKRGPGGAAQDRLIAGLQLMGATARRDLAASLRSLVDAMALADDEPPAMFFEDAPRPRPGKATATAAATATARTKATTKERGRRARARQ